MMLNKLSFTGCYQSTDWWMFTLWFAFLIQPIFSLYSKGGFGWKRNGNKIYMTTFLMVQLLQLMKYKLMSQCERLTRVVSTNCEVYWGSPWVGRHARLLRPWVTHQTPPLLLTSLATGAYSLQVYKGTVLFKTVYITHSKLGLFFWLLALSDDVTVTDARICKHDGSFFLKKGTMKKWSTIQTWKFHQVITNTWVSKHCLLLCSATANNQASIFNAFFQLKKVTSAVKTVLISFVAH